MDENVSFSLQKKKRWFETIRDHVVHENTYTYETDDLIFEWRELYRQ